MVEFDKRSPIYEQLKQYYKQVIVAGEYQPGEKLPSRRDIAQEFKINPNTVQRALKELEEEEIIVSEPNVPSTVTVNEAVINNLKRKMLDEAIAQFYESIQPLSIESKEVMTYLEEYISERGVDHA